MKYFSQGARTLEMLTTPMKVSVTFFIIFLLLGLVTSIAMTHFQTGFDSKDAAVYYLGNENDMDATVFHVKKSYRQMLETAHFHLYIMPLVYLAFVHIFFLTTRSELEKIFMTVLAFGGMILEIASPWLIRFVSPGLSVLFWISGIAITVSTLWMSVICLVQLWSKGKNE